MEIIDIKDIPKMNKSINKKEYMKQYSKQYYQKNKEKILIRTNKYNNEHKGYFDPILKRLKERTYYYKNLETERIRRKNDSRRYYKDINVKNKYHSAQKRYRDKIRKEILELLGSKCNNPYNLEHLDWCNDINILQIDHINGCGAIQRRKECGSFYVVILDKIKNGSKEYQLLCPNCNWLKKIKNYETGKKKVFV